MTGTNFLFRSVGIGSLLREARLAVPPNQRSYKWSPRHVLDLLQDLDEAMSGDDEDYFLGTIVLVQQKDGVPTIADGQQRLATTTMLLARIRDLVHPFKARSAATIDLKFIRDTDLKTEQVLPRLTLNTNDNDYFFRSILASPTDGEPHPSEPNWQSHKRLKAASETIEKFLNEKLAPLRKESHADRLLEWVDFLAQKVSVVVVTVPDEVDAFRIFETLNDRGLRAGQADILKNYFFSKAARRMAEAQAMWTTISAGVETLGEDGEDERLVTYIRHLWIAGHGPTKERDLAAAIKNEITSEPKTIRFLSDASGSIQDYLALDNPKHQKWAEYPPSVRKNIETIASDLQVQQIKPLMFAVALHFSPIEVAKAFKLFVSWSVRFLIFGGRGGMLDEQYSRRAREVGVREITTARELRDAMQRYVPTDSEFRDAFANARVSRSNLARYYLRAIEKTVTDDPQPEYVANEDVQDITLEHIMPMEPGEWPVDEEIARASQKRLGNMVLLRADQNRDLGNATFLKKRDVYARSGYYTTRAVAEMNLFQDGNWLMADIQARQADLADIALRTWTLVFDD